MTIEFVMGAVVRVVLCATIIAVPKPILQSSCELNFARAHGLWVSNDPSTAIDCFSNDHNLEEKINTCTTSVGSFESVNFDLAQAIMFSLYAPAIVYGLVALWWFFVPGEQNDDAYATTTYFQFFYPVVDTTSYCMLLVSVCYLLGMRDLSSVFLLVGMVFASATGQEVLSQIVVKIRRMAMVAGASNKVDAGLVNVLQWLGTSTLFLSVLLPTVMLWAAVLDMWSATKQDQTSLHRIPPNLEIAVFLLFCKHFWGMMTSLLQFALSTWWLTADGDDKTRGLDRSTIFGIHMLGALDRTIGMALMSATAYELKIGFCDSGLFANSLGIRMLPTTTIS